MRGARNPYLDSGLMELSDAAERVAAELLTTRVRSPDERRRLAQECAHLLLALGRAVRPGYHADLAPEFRVDRAHAAASFAAWLERERVALRALMLRRAAEFIGVGPGHRPPADAYCTDAAAVAAVEVMVEKK